MIQRNISIIILIFIFFLSIFIFHFKDEILNIIITNKDLNERFIVLYIILSFIYFLTPLPVSIVVILNGYILKEYGFFISILQILIGSLILKSFSNFITNKIKFDFTFKKINLTKLSTNNYSIFISRFVVPYFLHNIYYGLTKLNSIKFLILIFSAEIPITYALNEIGNSMSKISLDFSQSLYTLYTDINFYIPFLIIFMLLIIMNYLFKNIK